MPITIYGDGYITGLGNVSVSSNVAVGNVTLTQNNLIANLTTDGWQRLPSGLIMQWGYYAGGVHGVTISFPIVFPTAVLNLSATAATDNSAIAVFPSTTSSFTATQLNASNDTNNTAAFYWFAIGY